MSNLGVDPNQARKEHLGCSRDHANVCAASATQLLSSRESAREHTFGVFTIGQFGALTFALSFDAAPMWQTVVGAAYFGLLGTATLGVIQYSIQRLQDYLRFLEPFQRSEKEEMPISWLEWRDRFPGRFVGMKLTLRCLPMLGFSIMALLWSLWQQSLTIEDAWLAASCVGLLSALYFVYRFCECFREDRARHQRNRAVQTKPVVMDRSDSKDTHSACADTEEETG